MLSKVPPKDMPMTEQILNDRYALEQKVGEGGMAVTYRARDLLLNRVVAVKLMREQFTSDPQFVERFRREAQAAARLSHENIANVYDTGRANGTYYIVMEFVEGTDLKQRLRRDGPLPLMTVLEIGKQIASALEAAHRNGLVHRDIKPHNILLNKEGKVKVTDFGIAKLATDGDDTGVIIGSVHYLSPEQARGEATTPGSDLYALGAVLFEMLTGRTVFEGENVMSVAHKQIYEQPPMPRTLRPDVPPAVESVVLRCLEKDVRARYQSAAEVKAVLTQIANQLAQEATVVVAAPSAPSMDATMVYRKPATPAGSTPPQPTPPRPMVRAEDAEPPRGGATGWIIGIVFLVLAFAVTYGAMSYIKGSSGGDHEPIKPVPITVPDLSGLTKDQAIDLLTRRGFKGQSNHEVSEQVPENQVCRQDPAAGAAINGNTPVLFWVSDGPTMFTMPEVGGMSLDAAKNEIKNVGFRGQFTQDKQPSDTVAKGFVISVTPPTGSTIDRHKVKVKLTLSSGPDDDVPVDYDPGSVPDLGSPDVFVRVEMEKPAGSTPTMLFEGTLKPGDPIPVQQFRRKSSEHVLVRTLAGKDETSLVMQGEERFPAGNTPTPPPIPGQPASPGKTRRTPDKASAPAGTAPDHTTLSGG